MSQPQGRANVKPNSILAAPENPSANGTRDETPQPQPERQSTPSIPKETRQNCDSLSECQKFPKRMPLLGIGGLDTEEHGVETGLDHDIHQRAHPGEVDARFSR